MLQVKQLSKRFLRNAPAALSDVSFTVEQGAICGLLGHNGAGKSTALGIMLGMVYADHGEVIVDGISVQTDPAKAAQKIGAIFEAPAFYEYLSGWRNLQILTSYSGGVTRGEMDKIVEWVGLEKRIKDKVGTYSHGMRQRLALAQALLPRPELLLLDEPTDGLDPEGIVEFRRQLFELRDEFGITVLLSSHLLSEVEQVCDQVVILQKGELVYEGKGTVENRDGTIFEIQAEKIALVIESVKENGGHSLGNNLFRLPSVENDADLLDTLTKTGARVSSFTRKEETLESFYLKHHRSAK